MIEIVDLFERTPGRWHPEVMRRGVDWETVLVDLRQAILHVRTNPFNVMVRVKGDRLTGMQLEVVCANPVIRQRVLTALLPVVTPEKKTPADPEREVQLATYQRDKRVLSLIRQIDGLDKPDLTDSERIRLAMFIRILNDLKDREYPDL